VSVLGDAGGLASGASVQLADPGEPRQLSQFVAMRLREQIISGQLRQGQFLRIDAIAKTLNVSMTPVREGLLLLQSEAYVRLIPRRGFVVNSFSRQDLHDLFWAQATLAAELASRAVQRITPEEIDRLEALNAAYESARESGDGQARERAGHGFHRAINLAARSPRLALILGSLAKQLPLRFYGQIEGLGSVQEYHPQILDAIRARDAKAAGSLMFDHILQGGEQLASVLERQGLWDDVARDESATA
jgi:DNA-binding GntR family transcriptional regulator